MAGNRHQLSCSSLLERWPDAIGLVSSGFACGLPFELRSQEVSDTSLQLCPHPGGDKPWQKPSMIAHSKKGRARYQAVRHGMRLLLDRPGTHCELAFQSYLSLSLTHSLCPQSVRERVLTSTLRRRRWAVQEARRLCGTAAASAFPPCSICPRRR